MNPNEAAPDHADPPPKIVVNFRSARTWIVLFGWALFTALFVIASAFIASIMAPHLAGIVGPTTQSALSLFLPIFVTLPLFLLAMFLFSGKMILWPSQHGRPTDRPGAARLIMLWFICYQTMWVALLILLVSTADRQDTFISTIMFSVIFMVSGMVFLPTILSEFSVMRLDRGSDGDP